jgi:hypothetical protein
MFKNKYLRDYDLSIASNQKLATVTESTKQPYTGGKLSPIKSEFTQVVKRRRSRLSVNAPTTVDFLHIGDTSKFEHLINNRSQNKGLIQFGMNLRGYKATSRFEARGDWQFPHLKLHSPKG